MSVSPHEKKKFGDYVRIHAVDGELITREDETKVLKEGITQFGLDLNEARGILIGIAADHDIALVSAVFVITGDSAQELADMRDKVRMQIAFYASTRSYWPVLEAHGWGDVGRQLNRMAAQGDWDSMARAITDEMLDVYAVTGALDEIPAMLRARYDGLLDRIAFYFPYRPGEHEARWRQFVQAFNA